MPKGSNQKLKLLYIRDYLRTHTNEAHPAQVQKILAHLAANGITAERKSIYDDVAQLQQYGEEIELIKGRNGGYYCVNAEFDLPEIKMLVDSVQSCKFLTEQQSLALIKKLETLTNEYDAAQLHRQVVVQNRVKTAQKNVFTNIDHISYAINEDRAIRFRYLRYNLKKETEFRREGKIYEVSPFCLLWDDENYYLLAYDAEAGRMKHYRVDKMVQLHPAETARQGKEAFAAIDLSAYSKRVFRMFSGEEELVRIRFDASLIGVVLDTFGRDVSLTPEPDGQSFTVTARVEISDQFYGWLFGLSGQCEVLSPPRVRADLLRIAQQAAERYRL